MTAIPERLNAAADRLEALDHAGTWAPWRVGESWAGGLAVLTDGGHPIAVVSQGAPSETARADADLIATLRPLAPVIAAQVRRAADRWAAEIHTVPDSSGARIEVHGRIGNRRACCLDVAIDGQILDGDERCTCWDAALALADIILGGAS